MGFLKMMLGLVFGAAVGAGLMLLFTPRSGPATRQWVRDRVQGVLEEGGQAREARRAELVAQFEALKQPRPRRS